MTDPALHADVLPARMSLKSSTVWNLIGSVTPMALGLVTIPYLIRQAGVEAFGVLTLVWSLIGYFSIFDFGIGRALTQQVATHRSERLATEVPALIKAGLQFMFVTGTLGGIVLAAAAHPLGYQWLNVSPELRQDTTICLLIAAAGIPLTTLSSGLKGVLEGYEDFRVASILRLMLGVTNFGLPALTVMFIGPSLAWMVASLVVARLLVLTAHVVAVHGRVSVLLVARVAPTSVERSKELLKFGAWMTASNIVSPLMVTADRFIISFLLGASVVAYYTVPFDFILRLLIIPAALTGALFPRFAYLFKRDRAEVRLLYRRSLVAILAVMSAIGLLVATGSHFGLAIWVGPEFAERSWLIASVLAIGMLFNSLAQVPHAAIQAAGDVKTTSLLHLAEFVAYLPILVAAVKIFGLLGAAVVWVLRVTADFALLSFFARRRMS
jgi:O-antigen/teichoic acid export membrane protein